MKTPSLLVVLALLVATPAHAETYPEWVAAVALLAAVSTLDACSRRRRTG
jgi:hypothetical protein